LETFSKQKVHFKCHNRSVCDFFAGFLPLLGGVCDNLLTKTPLKFSVLAPPDRSRQRVIREAGNSGGKESTAIAGDSERNVF